EGLPGPALLALDPLAIRPKAGHGEGASAGVEGPAEAGEAVSGVLHQPARRVVGGAPGLPAVAGGGARGAGHPARQGHELAVGTEEADLGEVVVVVVGALEAGPPSPAPHGPAVGGEEGDLGLVVTVVVGVGEAGVAVAAGGGLAVEAVAHALH